MHNIRNEYKEKIDSVVAYQKFNSPTIAQFHFDIQALEGLVNQVERDLSFKASEQDNKFKI